MEMIKLNRIICSRYLFEKKAQSGEEWQLMKFIKSKKRREGLPGKKRRSLRFDNPRERSEEQLAEIEGIMKLFSFH